MTPAEYAAARPSTTVRENVARSLFQLLLAPMRLTWRVLPTTHPARIYAHGRSEQSAAAMEEALGNAHFRAMSWAVKLTLVASACCIDTITDLLNVNPISTFFGL